MVWPILISLAVTPRISAAVEAADHISMASALRAPNLVTKRIDTPPHLCWRAQTAAVAGAVRPAPSPLTETCHDAGMDANRNHHGMRGKTPVHKKRGVAAAFSIQNGRPLRLRLRLQPGVRIGPRARLAGRRHRRGARRGRLQ